MMKLIAKIILAASLLCLPSLPYADGIGAIGAPRVGANSFGGIGDINVPSWVLAGATIDLDFANGLYFGCATPPTDCISITRASAKTNLVPSSISGFAYTTFGNNVLAITAGSGILIEEARTNQLLNSAAPATQTTGSLANGTYTLWVNGSGSAQMSLGTGVGCGVGTATNGTPVNFTISTPGTCIVTVTGSLNAFQLELGSSGTSLIVTAGATATRAADAIPTAGLFTSILAGVSKSMIVAASQLPAVSVQRHFIGGGGGGSPVYMFLDNAPTGPFANYSGSTVLNFGAVTAANANKYGASFNSAGRSIVANNGTVATDSAVQNANGASALGSTASANYTNGYVSRATLWNTRIPDAALKALTQ